MICVVQGSIDGGGSSGKVTDLAHDGMGRPVREGICMVRLQQPGVVSAASLLLGSVKLKCIKFKICSSSLLG